MLDKMEDVDVDDDGRLGISSADPRVTRLKSFWGKAVTRGRVDADGRGLEKD